MEGAVSYEMELCDSNGEVIKTYTTETAGKAICANRGDSAVTGCMRGCKVRVRAMDAEGNVGKWTEYSTVGCNSLRG